MAPRIGISIITTALQTLPFLPGYGRRIDQFCKETGMSIQMLPLLTLNERELVNIDADHVISFESAWNNHEGFREWLRRLPRDPMAILGPILFGFPHQSEQWVQWFKEDFPCAIGIDTDGSGPNDAIETSPTNFDSEILPALRQNRGIVIDLWHLRGNACSKSTNSLGMSRLRQILDHDTRLIKAIHVQSRDKDELSDFLGTNFSQCALGQMLWELKTLITEHNIPVIIELMPRTKVTLLRVRDRIIDVLET